MKKAQSTFLFAIALLVLVSYDMSAQKILAAPESEASDRSASPPAPAKADFNKPYGYHLGPILETIKATPEQKKAITAIMEEFRPKIEPMRAKFREARDIFLNGMMTGKSGEQIMSAQQEMERTRTAIGDEYMLMRLKVRKLLTPEQVPLYEEYRKKQGWRAQ